MFTNMQDWTEIRRKVLVEGVSKRQICRDYAIAFETLQKILSQSRPATGAPHRGPRRRSDPTSG